MTIIYVAGTVVLALGYRWLVPPHWRGWALLIASVGLIYWVSPTSMIPGLTCLLPSLTLLLVIVTWWATRSVDSGLTPDDRHTLAVVIGLAAFGSGLRWLLDGRGTSDWLAGATLGVIGLALFAGAIWARQSAARDAFRAGLVGWVIGLFVVLKAPPLARAATVTLAALLGSPAPPESLTWLGYSYVAFRLLHMHFDRRAGRLPDLSLRESLTYVLFFPAFLSGPIDRAERFVKDYHNLADFPLPDTNRLLDGGQRILLGVLKKFVIADTLAPFVLGPVTAGQFTTPGGGWILLYLYGLRLYLDFSGYTDIAIGVGLLLGVRLPENFARPYLKTNLATFWQSWHITLSNWARYYVFSPISRAMLKREPRPSPLLSVFVAQLATMLVIGLWHGITWPFVVWGLWHGLGLFGHKWWSDRTRRMMLRLHDRPRLKAAWTGAAWFLTFQFVMLGWVWFCLPEIDQAVRTFGKLFGVGG